MRLTTCLLDSIPTKRSVTCSGRASSQYY